MSQDAGAGNHLGRTRARWQIGLLVTLIAFGLIDLLVAGVIARAQVCNEYEQRGIIDCGGSDGFGEVAGRALAYTTLALLIQAVIGLGLLGWTVRRRIRKIHKQLLRNTGAEKGDEPFATEQSCTCDPPWSVLESTANGHLIRADKSNSHSMMTDPALSPLRARCTTCHARYPAPWVTTDDPMQFAWAQDPPPGDQQQIT